MNQDDTTKQQAFAQSLRDALRASENLDLATSQRLAQARRKAVNAIPTQPLPDRRWLALAGLAAALVLTVTLYRATPSTSAVVADTRAGAETLDLLLDDKDPQFYRDLDFYKWLEQQQRHA